MEAKSKVMFRNILTSVGLSAAFLVVLASGCGKSETPPQADARQAGVNAPSGTQSPQSVNVETAQDAVAHFLDAIRRGGDTGGANSLLTNDACAVLKSLGRTVQPIGSPDAKFVVTRSEAVEGHPTSALVHSTWSEPGTGAGSTETYQVVWALEWEQQAWKISGLAMEIDPTQEPMIVDFEDHVQMANLFRSESEPTGAQPGKVDNVSQAPGNSSTF